MLNQHEIQKLLGDKAKVFGPDGEKIGTLCQIYLDDQTGAPNFATVHTGLFGMAENFVPLDEARISGEGLYVNFPKDVVKDAPNVEPGGHLSEGEEDRLYSYYALAGIENTGMSAPPDLAESTSPLPSDARMLGDEVVPTRPRLRRYIVPEGSGDETVEPHVGGSLQPGARENDLGGLAVEEEASRPGREDRLAP